ncbi:unnamed protein product, partial [Prorocentrum cordatum]
MGLQPARSSGAPGAPLLTAVERATQLEVAAFGARAAGEPGAGSLDVNERRRTYARRANHAPPRDTAQQLGIAEQASVQQRTFASYTRSLAAFMIFCGPTCFIMPAPSSGEKLIAALMMFLPDCHVRGWRPLPRASRALRGWRRLAPTKTRQPLPWAVCCAMAMQVMAEATPGGLPCGPEAALAWIMMVDTYLRPGEALRLMSAQILGPCGILAEVVVHVNSGYMLRASKTGEMDETATISRRWIGTCLMALATRLQGQPLWPLKLSQMKDLFDRAAVKVGLAPLAPVLYMARRSGASVDRQGGRLALDEVGNRGRWRTLSSVRRCQKRGLRRQEVWNNLSERQRRYCESAVAALAARLEAGPLWDYQPFYIELLSGPEVWCKGMRRRRCKVYSFDILQGPGGDLLRPAVMRRAPKLVRSGHCLGALAGVPCATFSMARGGHNAIRSKDFPAGLPGLPPHLQSQVEEGNRLFYNAVRIFDQCRRYRAPFLREGPQSSYAWHMPDAKRILAAPRVAD